MTDQLWRWSAVDLAQAIARGAISSEDATRSVLARIEAVNPKINAVVMGAIYTLVFGFGLVLCLKALSFEGLDWLGYVLSDVGLLGLVGNYFVYRVFLAHRKAIYGEKIVEVSKKILG